MVVTYDILRALEYAVRAVDAHCEGLWDQVTHDREELIREAKGCIDEAAALLSELLAEELHPYVGAEDVAFMAAALALREMEDWDVAVEVAAHQIEQDAAHRYEAALVRGA